MATQSQFDPSQPYAPAPTAKKQFDPSAPYQAAIDAGKTPPAKEPGILDREIPLGDHWYSPTLSGVQSIGRGVRDAATGAVKMFSPPSDPDEQSAYEAGRGVAPIGGPIGGAVSLLGYRTAKPFVDAAAGAKEIPDAIHDINQSDDPLGTYAKAAQETAGQGAGQAIAAIAADKLPAIGGEILKLPAVAKVVSGAGDLGAKVVRGAAKGANTLLEKAPASVGSAIGAGAGGLAAGRTGAEIGGAIGYGVGRELLPKIRVPGEDFGIEPVYPGAIYPEDPGVFPGAKYPENPGVFPGANLPANPTPEQLNPALLSPSRTLPGQISPEQIRPTRPEPMPIAPRNGPPLALPAAPPVEATADFWAKTKSVGGNQSGEFARLKSEMFPGKVELTNPEIEQINNRMNAPQAEPAAAAPIGTSSGPVPIGNKIKPAQVEQALNDSLGGRIPDGHTPVKSSALRSYKYDPATREFEAATNTGTYIHGDVSPEQAQAFEAASSKGRAWADLKKNSTYVGKIVNGQRVSAIPPRSLASASPDEPAFTPPEAPPAAKKPPQSVAGDDLTDQLQKSLDQVKGQKAQGDEQSHPFADPQSSTTYGKQNRGVSAKDAEQARASLRNKLFRSHMGLDPTMLADAAKLGAYHVEAGLREFGAWSQKMVDELGEKVRPHLAALWEQSKPFELTSPEPDAPMFYSKAAKVIDEKMGGTAPGDSVLATLRNAGVKAQEIEWTGLDDYLAGKKKVTKAEVQQFLKENQIKLEETSRGHDPQLERELNQAVQRAMNARTDFADAARNEILERTGGAPTWVADKIAHITHAIATSGRSSAEILYEFYKHNDIGAPSDAVLTAGRDAFNAAQDAYQVQRQIRGGETKYEDYTLPGDKSNYTEMLLRLPDSEPGMAALRGKFADAEAARSRYLQQDRAVPGDVELQFLDAQQALRKAENNTPNRYKSGHFDEPNILAHVRFDDRPTPGAQKTLFVEEVQSDWHQAGKKKGYQSSDTVRTQRALENFRDAMKEKYSTSVYFDKITPEERATYDRLSMAAGNSQAKIGAVPDAPFKNDWHELVMKRMLRHAAENGYDRMAWVTGEQTAERYDLSKHLDRIEYNPDEGRLLGYDHSGEEIVNKRMDPSELPDYIGKDAGKNLQKQIENYSPPSEDDYEIAYEYGEDGEPTGDYVLRYADGGDEVLDSGTKREMQRELEQRMEFHRDDNPIPSIDSADLKIGGEWAQRLYDQAIPNFLNKYAKKWGAKVGETEVTSGANARVTEKPSENQYNQRFEVTWKDKDGEEHVESFRFQRDAENYAEHRNAGEKVHSIDITPAMKKSVLKEGQPIARKEDLAPAEFATA